MTNDDASTYRRIPPECIRLVEGCSWNTNVEDCVEWDDGHTPETVLSSCRCCQLHRHPVYHKSPELHVVDNSVHPSLLNALYRRTVTCQTDCQQPRPWGTYVTIEEALQAVSKESAPWDNDDERDTNDQNSPEEDYALAVPLVSDYLRHLRKHSPSIQRDAHGVAVWALASDVDSQVAYHMDYAEQLRYEHNILVPPLWAGTLHCTSGDAVKGGSLCVHTGGLEHYHTHGYKGKKSGSKGDWRHLLATDGSTETWKEGSSEGNATQGWIDIPFVANRMIIMSGHLPHLSTPVQSLSKGTKRVIVGFNVFGHNIGSFVQAAPEHSPAFRKRVAIHRLLKKQTKALTIDTIKENPGVARLLVRARRQRAKDEFAEKQQALDGNIDRLLSDNKGSCTLADLVHGCAKVACISQENVWPQANDVVVHVSLRCRQGRYVVVNVTSQETIGLLADGAMVCLRDNLRV